MKRNLLMMAVAVVAMLATSCQKENNVDGGTADKTLNVRIANAGTKAEGPVATAQQIALTNGIIFVTDAAGVNVVQKETIDKTAILSPAGQELTKQVRKEAKVFIAANLPAATITKLNDAATLTVAEINAEILDITDATYGQDYKSVTLSNTDGAAKEIGTADADNKATVTVSIAPAYARVELVQLESEDTDKATITGYNATGVYVTDYHLKYTIGGGNSGVLYEQKQSTDFSTVNAVMKDEGTWAATQTGGNGPWIATATAGNAWVYNVPAGALPRLIMTLANVTGANDGANYTGIQYLTLTSYTAAGAAVTSFERGKIYKLTTLKFNGEQFSTKPNDKDVTLSVEAVIQDWTIVDVTGGLQ